MGPIILGLCIIFIELQLLIFINIFNDIQKEEQEVDDEHEK